MPPKEISLKDLRNKQKERQLLEELQKEALRQGNKRPQTLQAREQQRRSKEIDDMRKQAQQQEYELSLVDSRTQRSQQISDIIEQERIKQEELDDVHKILDNKQEIDNEHEKDALSYNNPIRPTQNAWDFIYSTSVHDRIRLRDYSFFNDSYINIGKYKIQMTRTRLGNNGWYLEFNIQYDDKQIFRDIDFHISFHSDFNHINQSHILAKNRTSNTIVTNIVLYLITDTDGKNILILNKEGITNIFSDDIFNKLMENQQQDEIVYIKIAFYNFLINCEKFISQFTSRQLVVDSQDFGISRAFSYEGDQKKYIKYKTKYLELKKSLKM
jgi:hypothetical protein